MKKTRKAKTDQMNYRSFAVRTEDGGPVSLDEKTRSVDVTVATENPVEVFDFERWEVIREVLLMDGCEMPKSRQIPLLDVHRRDGAGSVLGSCRGLEISGGQLVGRTYFSSVPEAEGPYTKVREGHLTDFSAGYRVVSSEWVPENETATIRGRRFEGPVKVATRWRVKEVSVCPIGADEAATARADITPRNLKTKKDKGEKNTMNKRLRQILEARGLSKDATEEEAWQFMEKLEVKRNGPQTPRAPEPRTPEDIDRERRQAAEAERGRIREITAMCARFSVSDMAEALINDGKTLDQARQAVMNRLDERPAETPGFRAAISLGADERDKYREAATDALIIRSGLTIEKPAPGADDLTGYSLRELARHFLQVANRKAAGNPLEMVGRALTSSDFPLALANTANKSLFSGFDTAEETWNQWCGTGQVSDFKTHSSVRVSETTDLEEIPEGGKYKYDKRSEAQETYSIATYGKILSITRQAIINDDLNALTSIPRAHGEAAARKIGDIVYAVLSANSAMGDGKALFHADHANFVPSGSGAVPGVDTIAAGIKAMGTQKDLAGKRRLNIRPWYFLAPRSLEGAAEVFFKSEKFDDSDKSATRVNPYAGKYFTRVYDARLDDDDPAAWYLAARKGKTVVVFFLNGQQRPYMETRQGWTVDGVEYKVRIDAGAKAMDWRGLYMNDGD